MFYLAGVFEDLVNRFNENKRLNNVAKRYPLSPKDLPNKFLVKRSIVFVFRSSQLLGVISNATISPCSLIIKCSLNP